MRRWMIRNVSDQAIQMVAEVSDITGIYYGDLVNEAIVNWYDNLPEHAEDEEDTDETVSDAYIA